MEKEKASVSVDRLIKIYLKIRDARLEAKTKFEDEDEKLAKQLMVVQNKILEFCKESGLDSVKSTFGTASRTVKSKYWTNDWDSYRKFVKENDALELFEKRIHQGAMKEFMDQNPDVIPPGINVSHEYAVVVRRAK